MRPNKPTPSEPAAQRLPSISDCHDALLALAGDARYRICLLSEALDTELYGSRALAGALQRFLLDNDRARLQVLVADEQRAVAQRHMHLIELGRRLSSRVGFRQLPPEHAKLDTGEWIIADETGLLERPLTRTAAAQYWRHAPLRARQRHKTFAELWELSSPSSALRALNI